MSSVVAQNEKQGPKCSILQEVLKDHVQAIKSISVPRRNAQKVPYITLTRRKWLTWRQLAQVLGLQGDVQAVPCHLKYDHHLLGSRSSDSHEKVSRPTKGHPRYIGHIINISNNKHHGLNVLAYWGSFRCQASREALK